MRLEPLHRVRFSDPEAWFIELEGAGFSIVLDVQELVWEPPGD